MTNAYRLVHLHLSLLVNKIKRTGQHTLLASHLPLLQAMGCVQRRMQHIYQAWLEEDGEFLPLGFSFDAYRTVTFFPLPIISSLLKITHFLTNSRVLRVFKVKSSCPKCLYSLTTYKNVSSKTNLLHTKLRSD